MFPFLDLGPFEGTLRLLISRDSRRGLFVGRTQSVYWSENGEKTTVSGKYEMLDYDQFDMFDALMTDDGAVVVSYRDDKLMICRLGDDASEIVNKRHGLGDVRALDVFQRDRIAFGFGDGRIEVWTIPHLAPYFEDWAAWTSKTLEPLLNEGEYFALEKQLASLRKSPTYSPDGWSQLGAAYNALAAPRDANGKPDAAARPARLAALQAWRKAVPSSIAARIALAEWHRGELESTVGKLGLDNVVERHLAAAEQALIFPNGEHDEDVHYYRLLIQLAYWGKKPREDVVGLVKAGQEIDPGEPSLYQHAFDFARRSRNDPGEGESLLREVCSDLPESAQLEIYFRTALFAVEQARRERASFPRDAIEKEGFDVARLLEATPVLRAKHPYEQPILQAAMYFAYLADDHEMRRRLGPRAGAYTYQGVAGVSGAEVLKGWARSEPIAGPSRSLRVSPAPIVQACFCDRDRGFAVVENSDRSTFREVNHVSHIGVASKLHYRSAPEASLRTLTIDQTVLTVAGDPTRPRAAVAAR
ncbi:MAG TPA: hypothetical protein VGE52_10105, partial [Pirellulales bacterium]